MFGGMIVEGGRIHQGHMKKDQSGAENLNKVPDYKYVMTPF